MITQDMRFNEAQLKALIGKKFKKYHCDPFMYTNSVTQNVGLFVGNQLYMLLNQMQSVDYFGATEDMAVFQFKEGTKDELGSALQGVTQSKTFVDETIKKIQIVNEEQRVLKNGALWYQVFLTRGIIFELENREISFEKDQLPFSEEIYIQRGHNLLERFSNPENFQADWDEEFTPECIRRIIEIE